MEILKTIEMQKEIDKILGVSKENAQSHDATIKFIQSDIFNNIDDKFDIIVSNPPYIDRKDEVTITMEWSYLI